MDEDSLKMHNDVNKHVLHGLTMTWIIMHDGRGSAVGELLVGQVGLLRSIYTAMLVSWGELID